MSYPIAELSDAEVETLRRVYSDLMRLAESEVPSVRAAARAAVALVAQALNGQGLAYDLYSKNWK